LDKNSNEQALANAFLYGLIDGETFKVIYNKEGFASIAWIENKEDIQTEVLLELDGIEVKKE